MTQHTKLDISGKKFGKLTAVKPSAESEKAAKWECICDCGNTCVVFYSNLVSGHTKSCGCLRSPDLTGQRFGRLTVLKASDKKAMRGKNHVKMWECRCDCGEITYKSTDSLKKKTMISCRKCSGKIALEKARKSSGYVDGTQISRLRSTKTNSNNTSGFRGVYQDKKTGKYRVRLRFKGKLINLGYFENYDEAVKARIEGEEMYFGKYKNI